MHSQHFSSSHQALEEVHQCGKPCLGGPRLVHRGTAMLGQVTERKSYCCSIQGHAGQLCTSNFVEKVKGRLLYGYDGQVSLYFWPYTVSDKMEKLSLSDMTITDTLPECTDWARKPQVPVSSPHTILGVPSFDPWWC